MKRPQLRRPRFRDDIGISYWAHFLIGPVAVRVALLIAFLALALSCLLVTVVKQQADRASDAARTAKIATSENLRLLHEQNRDRTAAVLANSRARHDDCEKLNSLRQGLRASITQGERDFPALVKLLHLPESFQRDNASNYQAELRRFKDDNCMAYALDALPRHDKADRAAAKRLLESTHLHP